jgi:predicted DNA-binding antitoxin AbrB/MazE fold protein
MKVKAVYESQVLRPLEKLDLKEGDEVEIVVKKNIADRTFGLIQIDPDVVDEIIEDTKYGPE